MKKKAWIASTLFTLLFFTSCSSSLESDASKVAELQCKTVELLRKAGTGEFSLEESTALAAETQLFDKEMKQKYSSAEEKQKFDDACLKAISKGCK